MQASTEPWAGREYVADGDAIRDYMEHAAHKHGISSHIRFGTTVTSADWDSSTDMWNVHTKDGATGTSASYRGRFVFFGSGYYNYDDPYSPDFPGIETFAGTVVHAQHWCYIVFRLGLVSFHIVSLLVFFCFARFRFCFAS